MWLRKTTGVPGAAPGGYTWDTTEQAVEVPDSLGTDLLAIRDAGFAEVAPAPQPDPLPTGDGPGEDAAPAARRPGRPRKTPVAE